jgi:hypothetical protein
MKRIVILWIMFFTIFSYTFADENLIEFKNISFSLPSFIYQSDNRDNQNIDFIDLNPMFFSNGNKYFSINYLENVSQNNRSQNNQRIYTDSQINIFSIFGSIIYISGMVYADSTMDRQKREISNDMWKQQREMENIYRNIKPDPARNFYQGNY